MIIGNPHSFLFFKIIYLFLAMLGLRCCVAFSLVAVHRLLSVVASLVAEYRL